MVDEGHRLRGHDVVLGDGEQRRLLEGQTPLDRAQDEQFGPGFLQQRYLLSNHLLRLNLILRH